MEYTKIEQGNEVVLTYRPTEKITPVILSYERELPERMRPEEPEPASEPVQEPEKEKVYASEALQKPMKRRRNVLACLFLKVLLSLVYELTAILREELDHIFC